MTTSTVFSSVTYNQNANGVAPVPAPTVVDAGASVTKYSFTLTVTPSTGWAKAVTKAGTDGVNFPRGGEIFVTPNSGGTVSTSLGSEQGPERYFTGEITEVSSGASATLTVTY